MGDKKLRATLIQWLVPAAVLLFIVITMLVDFSVSSNIRIQNTLENRIMNVAQGYADNISYELNSMTNTAVPIAEILADLAETDKDNPAKMAEILLRDTVAGGVIISDAKGRAVTSEGKTVNILNEEYFPTSPSYVQQYILTQKDTIYNKRTIISRVPIVKNNQASGYIFLFYSLDRFKAMLKKIEFDSKSFYAIVDDKGNIIEAVGEKSEFVQDNFLTVLSKAEITEGSYDNTQLRLSKKAKGLICAQYQGEARRIAFVPTSLEKWSMVVGVNESYITQQLELELAATRRVVWRIAAALTLFFGLVIIINIINRLREHEQKQKLENKADTDLLTELSNKMATERKIKEYIQKFPCKQGMMFVLDIDNFKKINDTMGHAFGDEVLRTLGLQIKAEFRVTDVLGRAGGDEFIIFLKDITDEDAVILEAEKMVRFFRNFKPGQYVKYSATASIGVAVFPHDGSDFDSLYKAADKALYKAKSRGKNQLAFYSNKYERRIGILEKEE